MSIDFSRKLINLRVKRDLTQQELGDLIGISPSQISRYEVGSAHPRKTTLVKLAAALGVPTEFFEKSRPEEKEPPSPQETSNTPLVTYSNADLDSEISVKLTLRDLIILSQSHKNVSFAAEGGHYKDFAAAEEKIDDALAQLRLKIADK